MRAPQFRGERTASPKGQWATAGLLTLLASALIAGVAGLLVAVAGTFPDVLDRTTVSTRTLASPAVTPRIILVILGSLRRDVAQDTFLMPRLTDARQRGSGGIVQTSPIPISAAFTWALAVGRPFSPLDIVRDFYPYRAPANSTIHQATTAGFRVCLVGTSHLTSPFTGVAHIVEQVTFTSFRDLSEQDEEVFRRSAALIRSRSCDLLILYLGDLDKVAHVFGGRSPLYRETVVRLDAMVGTLEDLSDRETTFLVVSDHGTNNDGDHAMPEPIVRDAPFVLWGNGVAPGVSATLQQIDLAPLLAAFLGFPIPPGALGTVPMELVSGPPVVRTAILERALAQKAQYLEAYSHQHRRPLPLGTTEAMGSRYPEEVESGREAKPTAITTLRRLDALYWGDLEARTRNRLALGATAGAALLLFLGLIVGRRPALELQGVLGGAVMTPRRTAVAAILVAVIGLLPATLPEPGTTWGRLAPLVMASLALSALWVCRGQNLFPASLATGAMIAWAIAFILPAWWPQMQWSVRLPAFRPTVLFREPVWVGLAVGGIGGLIALGRHRMPAGKRAAGALAVAFVLSLALPYTSILFHDLLHWALAAVVAASLWLLILRRQVSRGALVGAAGLVTLLAIRRLRGFTFTGTLGEAWWAPWVGLGIAYAVLLRCLRMHPRLPSQSRRYSPGGVDLRLELALLAPLVLAGVVRWLDLQALSRWMHPAILAVLGATWLLTHYPAIRLFPATLGVLVSSAYLLFDTFGFLILSVGLGFLLTLWSACIELRGRWREIGAGGLYFSAVWLAFFATGNEFDLSAVNALRKGMMGSDIGGAGGFSLEWTVFLILLKFTVLHLLPLLTLAAVISAKRVTFDWAGFLATGAMLHFALFLAFVVRYNTLGYSAAGGILVSAVSCLVFLLAIPIQRFAPHFAEDQEHGPA